MTTPGPQRRPDGHQRYLVRRVVAAALAVIAIIIAAGAGVWLQKTTGWSIDYLGRKARYGFVTENTEHESAVAIPNQTGNAPGTSNDRTPNKGGQQPNNQGGNNGGDGDATTGGELPEAPASPTHPAPVMRNTQHSTPLRKAPKPGDKGVVKLKSAGLNRQMVLRVPSDAVPRQSKANRPKPLIIAFHGYNQSGDIMSRFADLGREGAIVAYADGKGKAWAGAPYSETSSKQDFTFVRDIINRIAATYQVDDLRIYAAGMSNGGGFVAKLACEMPYEFAAFASVAGAYYPGTWQGCAKAKQRGSAHPAFRQGRTASFLEIHGEDDERIDYDGGKRYGKRYLSAMSFTGAFARRAECFGAPSVRNITPVVRRYQWRDCADKQDIMHVAVKGMGHTWPGEGEEARPGESGVTESRNDGYRAEAGPTRAVNGGAEILSFFSRHVK